ncbi:hypothetical protein BsWGS_15977 [Bradybaena similaris]
MSLSYTENFANDSAEANTTAPLDILENGGKFSLHLLVTASLINLCVCVLNPLTIVTILRTPSLRRCHSNIFLINLAVVDLFFMLMVVFLITKSWMGAFDTILCMMVFVYLGTACTASMLFCFAIAVDRFLFIHKALTYSTIVTHGRVLKVVASIWIASFVSGLLPLSDGKLIRSGCHHHESSIAIFIQSVTMLSLYSVTALISVCLYTKLFFVIREHNKVLEYHSLAQCGTHSCSGRACTVKTKLGVCRLRHSSSFTWLTRDSSASDVRLENKKLIFNHRVRSSAILSLASGIPRDHSQVFASEDDVSISLVDQSAGKTSGDCSQLAMGKDHSYSRHREDKELTEIRAPAAVSREPNKKRHAGQCQHLRDLRTIKALMMMFAIYFICWAPFMGVKLLHQVFKIEISERWLTIAWICAMSNSVWDFLVYPLRKKDFRDSMFKMVRRCLGLQPGHGKPRSLPTESGSDSVQNSLKKSSSSASRLSK